MILDGTELLYGWVEAVIALMTILLGMLAISGSAGVLLYGLMKIDKNHGLTFSTDVAMFLVVSSFTASVSWYFVVGNREEMSGIAWLLVQIYFLTCSVTDYMTCQVYDVFQYLGVGAAVYLLMSSESNLVIGASLILFALLQYFLFMRFYGSADGMAFLVAALAEGALGYDIELYLLHMIISYLLLSLVQGLCGNIGRKGRLKKATPFLPYISFSFWGLVSLIFLNNH